MKKYTEKKNERKEVYFFEQISESYT